PAPSFNFPGLRELLEKYRVKAAGQQIDPFGYSFAPFGYAAGQILASAVTETKSLDHDRLAQYVHPHSFQTVVGEIAYTKDGDWTQPRQLFVQFQNVAPNNLEQFKDISHEVVLWPEKYKTGKIIYPYADAKK